MLLRHFGDFTVAPSQIERRGIRDLDPADLQHAAAFGGTIRPIAVASWRDTTVTAYAGPAFVETTHQLCRVDGVQNAVVLTTPLADVCSSADRGRPVGHRRHGAGRHRRSGPRRRGARFRQPRACDVAQQAEAGWFVRLTSTALAEQEAPALLASLGVRLRRTLTSMHVGAATTSGSRPTPAAVPIWPRRSMCSKREQGARAGRFRVWNETRGFGGSGTAGLRGN